MIKKKKFEAFRFDHILFSLLLSQITGTLSQSTGTTGSTGFTSTTDITSSTGTGTGSTFTTTDPTTTDPPTTPYETSEDTEESNNVTWLIVGVVVGVVLVLIAVIGAAIAYAIHRSKRVHPHSDTESFCSESESDSRSRPTTASHIHLDPEDEAMSKPVAMTPFELRKLYIETFPYSKWKRGFDGSLRPHMGLKFVPPNIYAKTKGDEQNFREKIYNFEHSDTLTLRSSALSRMMRQTAMPSTREALEPLPENEFSPIANGTAPHYHHHHHNHHVEFSGEEEHHQMHDDVDLF